MARATVIVLSAAAAVAAAQTQTPTQITDSKHFLQAFRGSAIGGVDCGGHVAATCSACPGTNGAAWCNGDCLWIYDECERATWYNRFLKYTLTSIHQAWVMLPVTLLLALVMTAYALVYKKKVWDNISLDLAEQTEDGDKEQEFTLWSCFLVPDQCLWTTFCTPVVMAKNYTKGGVTMNGKKLEYWPTCAFVFCGVMTTFWPFWCIFTVIRAIMAGKLNRNLGFKANFCKDFLITLFCFPCDVGRESLEVDKALNVKITCPFNVEDTAPVSTSAKKAERSCQNLLSTITSPFSSPPEE